MIEGPGGRGSEAGVTLVEMLVALVLCALIGVAGLTMLDAILRVDRATEAGLDRHADIDRAFLVIGRDVLAADAGRLRLDEASLVLPAGPLVTSYRVEDGTLLRRTGAAEVDQSLLRGVSGAEWRVLDGLRAWHGSWPAPDAVPGALGVDLRMSLDGPKGGAVRRVFRATPGASATTGS